MEKIVVLDGWTLNPGDLSWDELGELGDLTVYDRTPPEEILPRSEGASILLSNKTPITAETIAALPTLRFIGVLATGVNPIDVKAARLKGIDVANVPGYSTESVVQSTWAHLLNLATGLSSYSEKTRQGDWERSDDFTFYGAPLTELAGKTFGVVGFGTIGRRVAQVAAAFGMTTIAYGPHLRVGDVIDGTRAVPLDDLFRLADVVSLHCPLTADNLHLVNRDRLAMMKPTAFLINTARGPLIDPEALADALNSGRLAGAGMDVLTQEPPRNGNPLLSAKNCFITPHNAWATLEARKRLMAITIENVRAFLAGSPQNVVN